jgi:hypothetical protein
MANVFDCDVDVKTGSGLVDADAKTAVITSGGGTPSGALLLQRKDA